MTSPRIEKSQPQHVNPYCPPSKKAVSGTVSVITLIAGGAFVGIALLQLRGTGAIAALTTGGALLITSGLSFLYFAITSCKKEKAPHQKRMPKENNLKETPKKEPLATDKTPPKSKSKPKKPPAPKPAPTETEEQEPIFEITRDLLRSKKTTPSTHSTAVKTNDPNSFPVPNGDGEFVFTIPSKKQKLQKIISPDTEKSPPTQETPLKETAQAQNQPPKVKNRTMNAKFKVKGQKVKFDQYLSGLKTQKTNLDDLRMRFLRQSPISIKT